MFSLLRTPLPASAVECSLACNLVSPSETSLVTAGADVLRVFRLRPHAGIAPGEDVAHVVSNAAPFPNFILRLQSAWMDTE